MTQARISTGYRVATASDNAAYWSIATTMRSDKSALSVVQDTLGLGAGKVDTAYPASTKAITPSARSRTSWSPRLAPPATDKAKIQTEITALQAQLKMGADGATFSGSNLLSLDTTTGTAAAGVADDAKVVSAFTRNSAGASVAADHRHQRRQHEAVRRLARRDQPEGHPRRCCASARPALATITGDGCGTAPARSPRPMAMRSLR